MKTTFIRCEPCTGTGIRGRWRLRARGRVWKLEACRACRGLGQREVRPPPDEITEPHGQPDERDEPHDAREDGLQAEARAQAMGWDEEC